jgi:hypothetical protein
MAVGNPEGGRGFFTAMEGNTMAQEAVLQRSADPYAVIGNLDNRWA